MRNILLAFMLICIHLTPQTLYAKETLQNIPGQYELQNVMEMAGLLTLNANNNYIAVFSYGAADWAEEGKWNLENETIVLSKSRFKSRNTSDLSLFLPSGTRFTHKDGKLTATGPTGKSVVFLDPNKTPSNLNTTGEPGEGRMLVKGLVLKLDSDVLVVKTEECMTFDVGHISPDVLNNVKISHPIQAEIPYSAIISSESCP